jgi:3',5'-cyclic-nucleotide phosphodiesterase
LSLPSNSFGRGFTFLAEAGDSSGIHLLTRLSSDLQLQETPQLVVPIIILRPSKPEGRESQGREASSMPHEECNGSGLSPRSQIARCLDAGAIDVLTQPLDTARVHGLCMHAYRIRSAAQKALSRFLTPKKPRKQSWVGVHTDQSYSYLREIM